MERGLQIKINMKILFVGNSHTFCNGLPYQVRELLRLSDPDVSVAMCATGGMTLGWHTAQPETQMAIKYEPWDYIVLQQKTHPFDGYGALLKDCKSLLPYIQKTRAEILLFMTWAEKRFPTNQDILDRAFMQTAQEIHARVVPVAKAWQRILQSEPDIELYDTDGEHANPGGSYLAACTFYAAIQGASPVGLPNRICVNGDVLADISQNHADIIQKAVLLGQSPSDAPMLEAA
jgi:hypothetical protein